MNDREHDHDTERIDDAWRDTLRPLRSLSAPSDVEESLMTRIATTRVPWWRRRIAVPVPMATAAVIALVVLGLAAIRPVGSPDEDHARADLTSEDARLGVDRDETHIVSVVGFGEVFRRREIERSIPSPVESHSPQEVE